MFRWATLVIVLFANPCFGQVGRARATGFPQLVLVTAHTPTQLTLQFTVYKPVLEKRVQVENKNGARIETIETIERQVPEVRQRIVTLSECVVNSIKGKPLKPSDLLAAAKKKKPLPMIFLPAKGKVSKHDQQFLRDDLLVVYLKEKQVKKEVRK